MKRWFVILAFLMLGQMCGAQVAVDSVWRADVKTVTLYRDGVELEAPVLTLGSTDRLRLQFDVLSDQPEHLRYTIAHCDADWRRDDLEPYEFLSGFESGIVEGYDFSFVTRVPYVHYHQVLPERYSEFTHSGNYVLMVSLSDEPDSVLLTRRFCVSEQAATVDATVVRPYDGIDIDRRQQVDVCVAPGKESLMPQYITVVAQQNGRIDNRRALEFSGYSGQALCFRNRPCNIFDGGNTFRFFDLSNLHAPMYNVQRVESYGGETFAIIKPLEDRSRKHYIAEKVLNGGMRVNVMDRTDPSIEADYAWVNISLPMAQPFIDGSVHIVGALTDWCIDSASRMEYNPRFRAYTARLLLKQGYYAYQLLFQPARGGVANTARLEGDHRETPNAYTLYVYYRTPADRADRLIACRKIIN